MTFSPAANIIYLLGKFVKYAGISRDILYETKQRLLIGQDDRK